MEAHANSVDDVLVDGLSYKLKNSAKYVTDRKSVTFHPSGSNIYRTSAGTKVLKINLTGDAWLIPESVRIMYTLKNNDSTEAKVLRPISGPWSFWRRMRILCGGQVIEDFEYGRVHEMMSHFHSEDARDNEDVEGFGYRYDDATNLALAAGTTASLPGIPGNGGSRRVSFKPLSGLLSQAKWLPIRYCPIQIELELVNGALDAIVDPAAAGFDAADTSVDWQIEDCQLKCDLATLDNAVDNQIADHLLSGKPLPINYQTYISQSTTVGDGSKFSVNVSRAVTRLSRVYMTLDKPATTAANTESRSKEWNSFFHPMATGVYDPELEFQFQVQIGSKLFPEYPVESLAEAFAALKKTAKDTKSDFHALRINAKSYASNKFIMATTTSKVNDAGFTGLNTRSGDLMTIKANVSKGSSTATANKPTGLFTVLESDQIIEIRDVGVSVFD
jgi:hypothetical protein